VTKPERVFITGLGAISALGCGYESLLSAVRQPVACFIPVPRAWLDLPGGPDTYTASLSSEAELAMLAHENITTDRSCAMALAAGAQAWAQAGLDSETTMLDVHASNPLNTPNQRRRYGVYWGTGMGGLNSIETHVVAKLFTEKKPLRPMTVVRVMSNAAAAQLAIKYALKGPNQTITNACSSSAIAIGDAFHTIRAGKIDLAMVGGSESMLVPGVMAAWGALRVLSITKHAATADVASRPFSTQRCGLVMGEGAAAFVIESETHMRTRGATPLAEIVGYASCCDAGSLVHPDADGQVYAMQMALADAGLAANDINNINAHATATDTGDTEEAKAIETVFGVGPTAPTVSATKSMHGHLLGGAAALEAAICVVSLQSKIVPATLGFSPIEPACSGLNLLASPQTDPTLTYIMSNSFAFGGSNASLIFKAV
jgi:3-oxoacyl-(acyl-carrier-protein) synthase